MINNVVLIGRLTNEPTLKMTANGKPVVAFTLAVQRDKEKADFVPCRAYSRTAELLNQYCKKGSQIALNGSIQTYTTESNGNKVYHVEVLTNTINFLESKPKESTTEEEPQSLSIDDDKLPF